MESFQNKSEQEDIDDYSPMWKFVTKVEKAVGGGNVTWSCNICTKVCKGSYLRVKAHLLKQKGAGIAGCTAVTMDQMKRMQQLVDDAELRKKNSKPKEVSLPSSSASSNMASKSSFSGPSPLQNDDPTLTKKRKGQLGPLEKAFNLNARDELHSEIARLFYTGGLSFNIARNPHYVRAFSLVTQRTIPGYLPPGYNLLRTSLLQKEKTHIEKLLEPTKTARKQKGVSICSDGWYYSHEWLQESPNRLPPHKDIEVSRERKKCIERYYSNSSERRSVNEEFASFSAVIDDFSDNDAIRDRDGFDSMDMEGASILEIVNLSLDEPELESVLFTDEGGVGDVQKNKTLNCCCADSFSEPSRSRRLPLRTPSSSTRDAIPRGAVASLSEPLPLLVATQSLAEPSPPSLNPLLSSSRRRATIPRGAVASLSEPPPLLVATQSHNIYTRFRVGAVASLSDPLRKTLDKAETPLSPKLRRGAFCAADLPPH
ncbi:hypothetical protein ZIOFF_008774 [Zingiber officinale]|uniref:BED-type domain-containing protein n=1 Tax=Zingiber officinale TaxID=94328 RepID=A0A8J5M723_ZINOF|nr:hypothetical protein ZIOFF_008774 [Zingiber officinale]